MKSPSSPTVPRGWHKERVIRLSVRGFLILSQGIVRGVRRQVPECDCGTVAYDSERRASNQLAASLT